MEISIFHWMIVLVVFIGVPSLLLYLHGKKVGNQQGYIRGYKEGQQSVQQQK
jgi:hypothetical protein